MKQNFPLANLKTWFLKNLLTKKKLLKHFLYNLVCVEFPVLFAEFDTERYEPKLLSEFSLSL